MKVKDVLEKLNTAEDDSENSELIFEIEEGKQDKKIKSGEIQGKRRDWLVIADIYNDGNQTQKFHLWNFLQFKIKKQELDLGDNFTYGRINNGALIVYIKEVIFEEDAAQLVNFLKKYYEIEYRDINKFKTTDEYKALQ